MQRKESGGPNLDNIMGRMSRKTLDQLASEPEPSPIDDVKPGRGEDKEQLAADLLDGVTNEDDHYIRVFRKSPLPPEFKGQPIAVYTIEDLTLLRFDLQSELLALGKRFDWVDGVYEVQLMKVGEPRIKRSRIVGLAFPKTKLADIGLQVPMMGLQPNGKQADPLEQLAATSKVFNDMVAEAQKRVTIPVATDPSVMIKAVTDNMTALMSMIQAQNKPAAPVITPEVITAMIGSLAPMLRPPERPQVDVTKWLTALAPLLLPIVQRMAARDNQSPLKEFADARNILLGDATPEQANDPISTLIKLKEAGLVPNPPTPTNPFDNLEKIISLVTIASPILEKIYGGGGSAPAASFGVEFLKTFGPQLGDIVKAITGTVNTAIVAKSGSGIQPQTAQSNTAVPIEAPVQEIEHAPATTQALSPEILGLVSAIEVNNTAFYPTLEELIMKNFGQQTLDLLQEPVHIKSFVEQMKTAEPRLGTEASLKYFLNFSSYLRSKSAPVEEAEEDFNPEKDIEIACKGCDAKYIFDKETLKTAGPQLCDSCGDALNTEGV